ncbi:MAG: dephospho-CoA kinase [Candidatus Omnitrophota bacterium]
MIIGITGSFGSGKTTVAKMFAKLGAYTIDADKVYHSLIKPGNSCYKKIVQHFGKGILKKNQPFDYPKPKGQVLLRVDTERRLCLRSKGRGLAPSKYQEIDTKKLGRIVFEEKSKLKLLNRLVQPEIIRKIQEIIKDFGKLIVVDAALLVESGFYKKVDKIIVVKNKISMQVKRLKQAKGLTEKDIIRRIRMQMPLKKKLAFADFIIDNSGSKKDTLSQARKVWEQIGE